MAASCEMSKDGLRRIVEQRTPRRRTKIREINSGIYCFDSRKLFQALEQVKPTNQQQGVLPDGCPAILLAEGETLNVYLHATPAKFPESIRGRNWRSLRT